MSYSSLIPGTDLTPSGRVFLATNLIYFIAGGVLSTAGGNTGLGCLCELAGTFSVWYHWAQSRYGNTEPAEVRLALIFDYAAAIPACGWGVWYIQELGLDNVPPEAVPLAVVGVASFLYGWLDMDPRRYMIAHGLWHLCGGGLAISIAKAYEVAGS